MCCVCSVCVCQLRLSQAAHTQHKSVWWKADDIDALKCCSFLVGPIICNHIIYVLHCIVLLYMLCVALGCVCSSCDYNIWWLCYTLCSNTLAATACCFNQHLYCDITSLYYVSLIYLINAHNPSSVSAYLLCDHERSSNAFTIHSSQIYDLISNILFLLLHMLAENALHNTASTRSIYHLVLLCTIAYDMMMAFCLSIIPYAVS